jgi:preprotein translocase subunit SecF
MKVLKLIFTLSLILIISTPSFAQDEQAETPKPSLNNGTIESQFDYLYRKSSSYQEYKVVKKTFYYKIKANVMDSLGSLKKELNDTKKVVESQNVEINKLKSDLKITNDNLTGVTKEKDSIKFLGIPMTKTAYNSLLWTIILGLVILLIFFIFRFKTSNSITKLAKSQLVDTENEFDAYKVTALEREQKVRRELQDELNKKKYSSKKGKKD